MQRQVRPPCRPPLRDSNAATSGPVRLSLDRGGTGSTRSAVGWPRLSPAERDESVERRLGNPCKGRCDHLVVPLCGTLEFGLLEDGFLVCEGALRGLE